MTAGRSASGPGGGAWALSRHASQARDERTRAFRKRFNRASLGRQNRLTISGSAAVHHAALTGRGSVANSTPTRVKSRPATVRVCRRDVCLSSCPCRPGSGRAARDPPAAPRGRVQVPDHRGPLLFRPRRLAGWRFRRGRRRIRPDAAARLAHGRPLHRGMGGPWPLDAAPRPRLLFPRRSGPDRGARLLGAVRDPRRPPGEGGRTRRGARRADRPGGS